MTGCHCHDPRVFGHYAGMLSTATACPAAAVPAPASRRFDGEPYAELNRPLAPGPVRLPVPPPFISDASPGGITGVLDAVDADVRGAAGPAGSPRPARRRLRPRLLRRAT
jgi:hypothetical protein